MTDPTPITLSGETAREIQHYLLVRMVFTLAEARPTLERWIAALTPPEKIVSDDVFDEYFNGETDGK